MDELTLSIGDLARRTGVDIPTLRRWERYAGLLAPTRTPGGQRRYGAGDVAAVEELVSLIGKGWAAASAARAVATHRDTGAVVFDATLLDAVPTGVVVTNAASQVLYANPAIATMLGVTPADLEAADQGDFLDDGERRHVLDAFEQMRHGDPQTYDVRLRTRQGDHVDVEVAAGPLVGPGGQIRGVVGVFHDLARTRAAERRSDLLARLVDSVDEAIIAVDADQRVLTWNAAATTVAPGLQTGEELSDALPEELAMPTLPAVRRALDGAPSSLVLSLRDRRAGGASSTDVEVRVLPLAPDAAIVMIVRVAPPAEPAPGGASAAYHGVVAALTQSVLTGVHAEAVVETAVRGVARALDASHVSFVEVVAPGGGLEVIAATPEEPVRHHPPAEPFGSHVGFALQSQRPIIVQDFEAELRFDRGPLSGEQEARSGICIPVRWSQGAGALSAHSAHALRDLGPAEVTFVQSAANVCAIALLGRRAPTREA